MMHGIWNARTGEWEEYNPETDLTWKWVRIVSLVSSSAASIVAIWWAIAWGLPQ